MNVRIRYDMTWRSGIWFQNSLQMNSYQIELQATTHTSNNDDHITCLNRINHFVYEEMSNTIFINQDDRDRIDLLLAAGCKITTLPEDPIDQVIGWILFLKLNSILEGRMSITDISIWSDLGDNIRYLHSDRETFGPVDDLQGWWLDPGPVHNLIKIKSNKKQIVKLGPSPSWRKLDLHWSDSTLPDQTANTVVFAQFVKDEE
jgi:hypothetical protein